MVGLSPRRYLGRDMGKSYSPILEYSDYLDAATALSLLKLVDELSRKRKGTLDYRTHIIVLSKLARALNFLKEVFNTVRYRLMSVLFRTIN